MMELLRYVALLWGVVYLVTQSAIFRPVRMMVANRSPFITTFIYCPSCFGTWVGFALTPLLPWDATAGWGWLESGLAAMALGRVWGRLFGDNQVFEFETRGLAWFREMEGNTHVGGADSGDADGGGDDADPGEGDAGSPG